ncbi:MAG: XRE family transcriptional regulator [Proteobacteria bacterium]|nr:XRE family transcriptional regulator [Pseudomonadota bacterium]
MSETKHKKGSKNVYKDLGVAKPDEMRKKAEIVGLLSTILKKEKLTQVEAAKILNISQPDLSKILNGRFRGYSVDRLMTFLTAFYDVEVRVKERKGSRKMGSWKVSSKARSRKQAA